MFGATLAVAVCLTVGADPAKGQPAEFAPVALGMKVPVLTDKGEFDKHLGQLVAIRGHVTRGKIPTIAGVDVNIDENVLRDGEECYAVGILIKWVEKREITPDLIQPARRGPGTYYFLYADLVGKLADAQPMPKK